MNANVSLVVCHDANALCGYVMNANVSLVVCHDANAPLWVCRDANVLMVHAMMRMQPCRYAMMQMPF